MTIPFDHNILARLSKSIYVVLMKDSAGNLTLLADPGMNRPWSSKNKRLADFHAKECDGEARPWGEAFSLLLKANPGFEKELIERVSRAKTDITHNIVSNGTKQNPPRV